MKRNIVIFSVLTAVVLTLVTGLPGGAHNIAHQLFNRSVVAPLSKRDSDYYAAAFAAQRKQDWRAADAALNAVSNDLLRGHVLADRYLHRKYTPKADEIAAWLGHYRDHPQAYDMYRLATQRYGLALPPVEKPQGVKRTEKNTAAAHTMSESTFALVWKQGIAAYSAGHYLEAATTFDRILDGRHHLSSSKRAAAGFWAWRSHTKLGNHARGEKALRIAANEPRSFYGLLAGKHLDKTTQTVMDANDEDTASADDLALLKDVPSVTRAAALVQAGRKDLAERELHLGYAALQDAQQVAVLHLADQLVLQKLRKVLAPSAEEKSAQMDLAAYPIPQWQPVGGFTVDPALIFALVRQESGFNSAAVSPAGASGLMQLMPATAAMMHEKMGHTLLGANELERHITLGQGYIKHLLDHELIEHNVIFMLTSYNAGIGRLQTWKKTLSYHNDPLLFIEQIPYRETRHYVMQVMTNYWLYSDLMGRPAPTLAALARNDWPVFGSNA